LPVVQRRAGGSSRRLTNMGPIYGLRTMVALAASLAPYLGKGDVVALNGELGTGKTTFARGLINALAGPDEVPSPTFTLVQVYEAPQAPLWHFDLYRISAPEDAYELGIEEALAEGICLIEWPDRLGKLLPRDWLEVQLVFDAEPDVRQVRLIGHGSWAVRLPVITEALEFG